MRVLVIAGFTLREAARKKAVLGGAVFTLIFLLLYGTGTYLAFRELNLQEGPSASIRQAINGEVLLAGLYFVDFIGGLLAIFAAVGTISSEIEQGTLHAVVPKPLARWEVVLGKWLGFAAMLTCYIVVTALVTIAIVFWQTRFQPPQIAGGIAVMVLHTLLLLSLTILGTTILSTVTNGITVFMLYALALAGGRLEQLGALFQNDTLVNIGIGTSLLIPSDALWRLSASMMSAGGFTRGGVAQPGMFTVADPPSMGMVSYAVVYATVALVAATMVFRKRDL